MQHNRMKEERNRERNVKGTSLKRREINGRRIRKENGKKRRRNRKGDGIGK
jgi:hypothetical protein